MNSGIDNKENMKIFNSAKNKRIKKLRSESFEYDVSCVNCSGNEQNAGWSSKMPKRRFSISGSRPMVRSGLRISKTDIKKFNKK